VPAPVIQGDEKATPNTNATAAHAEQKIPQAPAPKPASRDKWTCRATVVMAIATTFYTGFAGWQLRTMQRQLNLMDDSAWLEYSPWIGVVRTIPASITIGSKIQCRLEFANTGRTPAFCVDLRSNLIIGPANIGMDGLKKLGFGKPQVDWWSHGMIPPNAVMAHSISSADIVSQEVLNDILAYKSAVYVWGEITYSNTVGDSYKMSFCFAIDPKTGEYTTYKEGNDVSWTHQHHSCPLMSPN
jgi:hypothetical protein